MNKTQKYNWPELAWAESGAILQRILEHPFIGGLADGSLDPEKFKFYIKQDAIYLESFARALALIAARIEGPFISDFIGFSNGALLVEKSLHASYFDSLNIEGAGEMSSSCHHYASFLLSSAAIAPVEAACAAVYPCFRIYKFVGDHLLNTSSLENNPYADWIQAYSGEDFGELVSRMTYICGQQAQNAGAALREEMTAAYIYASKLEFMFWDSAWQGLSWQDEAAELRADD